MAQWDFTVIDTNTTSATVSNVATTNGSTTLTSSAAFGSVVAGYPVSGTGIHASAYVIEKIDASTLTISHPATASGTITLTYYTARIPDVIIPCDRENGYNRSIVEEVKIDRFTPKNTAVMTGTKVGARYLWSITAQMSKTDALRLGAMIRMVMKGQSYVYLKDEVREVDPETSPHSKTILGSPTAAGYASMVYGYGKFAVVPQRGEGSFKTIGKSGDLYTDLVQFSLVELPNVTVS